MFPMFIAHGPAFKKGHKTRNFNNVDLYPLMCLILGVTPAYNNGSIDNVLDLLEYTDVNTSFNLSRIKIDISFFNFRFLFIQNNSLKYSFPSC